jgi:hypothetical protein
MLLRALALAALTLGLALPARAQEKPVVALPLSGAFLTVSRDKANLTASLSRFLGHGLLSEIDLTAATGNGEDIAAVSSGGLAPGLDLAVNLQYDTRHRLLAFPVKHYAELSKLCNATLGKQACSSEDLPKTFSLSPIPTFARAYWSLGGAARVHYDQISAYAHLADASPANLSRVTVSAGGTATAYFAPAVAVKVESGYTYGYLPNTRAVHRCLNLPSANPAITGQSCADTQLEIAPATRAHRGYGRLSVTYLTPVTWNHFVPGMEVDAFAEDLGGHPRLDARGVFFMSPSQGAVYTRTGVGVTVSTALTSVDGAYRAGHLIGVTPFAFFGANF